MEKAFHNIFFKRYKAIAKAVAYAENNYFPSGGRHRYIKLKERKDTDGIGLSIGKNHRGTFDTFTEGVLWLIRTIVGHN